MMQNSSRQKKALVVEDEPVISRICQRTLMSEGYAVDIAGNGSIAKTMIDNCKYDLCLSDIRTPEMNGIELYHYLEKSHPAITGVVIFTTGDVLSNNVDCFLKEVKRPFLPKPFTPNQLRQAVRELSPGSAMPEAQIIY
jgi:DNA-binding NtrC family response regulator